MQQALEVTAIQGQRKDGLIADGSPQSSVGSIDFRKFSRDCDRLCLFAGLHDQIHANVLAHLHQHAAVLYGSKAFGFGADGIRSRVQAGRHVLSRVVGGQGSRDAAGHIRHGDHGAGNGAPGLVEYASLNRALVRLRKRGDGNQKYAEERCQHRQRAW